MEFISTIKQIKTNWNPYKQWENEQHQKNKQNQELKNKFPPTPQETIESQELGRTIINAINIMDQHSIDKSEDAAVKISYSLFPFELASLPIGWGLGLLIGKGVNKTKYAKKLSAINPFWGPLGLILLQGISSPIINIWQSKKIKQASRIARFQTRENDLKDSKCFVKYNQDQLDEARKIAKTLPDINTDKSYKITKDSFNPINVYQSTNKTTKKLDEDKKNYLEWKEQAKKEETQKLTEYKTQNYSKEDIDLAKKNRDILLNTVQKIENNSLEYYNNMEMAIYGLNSIVTFVSMGIGAGLSAGIAQLQKNVKNLKNNKTINIIKTIPFLVSAFIPVFLLAPANKLVKNAARIGRFKAKQELLNDPSNFIAYTDEQKNTVPLDKTTKYESKGLFKRFCEDAKAVKQLQKDAKEYDTYMQTTNKEELKLNEALKKINISEKQMEDAKNLQKHSFFVFEKIDEKAQRYKDDADAAIDSTRIIIGAAIALAMKVFSVFVCGKEIVKINNNKMPKSFKDSIKIIFTKRLTTKAALGLLAPFFIPPLIKVPLTIKGVQVKKDAGKIGVMNAMKELDNPAYFTNKNDNKQNKIVN